MRLSAAAAGAALALALAAPAAGLVVRGGQWVGDAGSYRRRGVAGISHPLETVVLETEPAAAGAGSAGSFTAEVGNAAYRARFLIAADAADGAVRDIVVGAKRKNDKVAPDLFEAAAVAINVVANAERVVAAPGALTFLADEETTELTFRRRGDDVDVIEGGIGVMPPVVRPPAVRPPAARPPLLPPATPPPVVLPPVLIPPLRPTQPMPDFYPPTGVFPTLPPIAEPYGGVGGERDFYPRGVAAREDLGAASRQLDRVVPGGLGANLAPAGALASRPYGDEFIGVGGVGGGVGVRPPMVPAAGVAVPDLSVGDDYNFFVQCTPHVLRIAGAVQTLAPRPVARLIAQRQRPNHVALVLRTPAQQAEYIFEVNDADQRVLSARRVGFQRFEGGFSPLDASLASLVDSLWSVRLGADHVALFSRVMDAELTCVVDREGAGPPVATPFGVEPASAAGAYGVGGAYGDAYGVGAPLGANDVYGDAYGIDGDAYGVNRAIGGNNGLAVDSGYGVDTGYGVGVDGAYGVERPISEPSAYGFPGYGGAGHGVTAMPPVTPFDGDFYAENAVSAAGAFGASPLPYSGVGTLDYAAFGYGGGSYSPGYGHDGLMVGFGAEVDAAASSALSQLLRPAGFSKIDATPSLELERREINVVFTRAGGGKVRAIVSADATVRVTLEFEASPDLGAVELVVNGRAVEVGVTDPAPETARLAAALQRISVAFVDAEGRLTMQLSSEEGEGVEQIFCAPAGEAAAAATRRLRGVPAPVRRRRLQGVAAGLGRRRRLQAAAAAAVELPLLLRDGGYRKSDATPALNLVLYRIHAAFSRVSASRVRGVNEISDADGPVASVTMDWAVGETGAASGENIASPEVVSVTVARDSVDRQRWVDLFAKVQKANVFPGGIELRYDLSDGSLIRFAPDDGAADGRRRRLGAVAGDGITPAELLGAPPTAGRGWSDVANYLRSLEDLIDSSVEGDVGAAGHADLAALLALLRSGPPAAVAAELSAFVSDVAGGRTLADLRNWVLRELVLVSGPTVFGQAKPLGRALILQPDSFQVDGRPRPLFPTEERFPVIIDVVDHEWVLADDSSSSSSSESSSDEEEEAKAEAALRASLRPGERVLMVTLQVHREFLYKFVYLAADGSVRRVELKSPRGEQEPAEARVRARRRGDYLPEMALVEQALRTHFETTQQLVFGPDGAIAFVGNRGRNSVLFASLDGGCPCDVRRRLQAVEEFAAAAPVGTVFTSITAGFADAASSLPGAPIPVEGVPGAMTRPAVVPPAVPAMAAIPGIATLPATLTLPTTTLPLRTEVLGTSTAPLALAAAPAPAAAPAAVPSPAETLIRMAAKLLGTPLARAGELQGQESFWEDIWNGFKATMNGIGVMFESIFDDIGDLPDNVEEAFDRYRLVTDLSNSVESIHDTLEDVRKLDMAGEDLRLFIQRELGGTDVYDMLRWLARGLGAGGAPGAAGRVFEAIPGSFVVDGEPRPLFERSVESPVAVLPLPGVAPPAVPYALPLAARALPPPPVTIVVRQRPRNAVELALTVVNTITFEMYTRLTDGRVYASRVLRASKRPVPPEVGLVEQGLRTHFLTTENVIFERGNLVFLGNGGRNRISFAPRFAGTCACTPGGRYFSRVSSRRRLDAGGDADGAGDGVAGAAAIFAPFSPAAGVPNFSLPPSSAAAGGGYFSGGRHFSAVTADLRPLTAAEPLGVPARLAAGFAPGGTATGRGGLGVADFALPSAGGHYPSRAAAAGGGVAGGVLAPPPFLEPVGGPFGPLAPGVGASLTQVENEATLEKLRLIAGLLEHGSGGRGDLREIRAVAVAALGVAERPGDAAGSQRAMAALFDAVHRYGGGRSVDDLVNFVVRETDSQLFPY